MNTHDYPYRIKSERRKRRLVIRDRDKQLLKLDRRHNELLQQKRLLPLVPLESPYQRGWKRFFVLRDDTKQHPMAIFYEVLLEKINTVEYSRDRSFKKKKWRKQRYVYKERQQELRDFPICSWLANKVKLTDEEKACFERIETFDAKTWATTVKYVCTEAWRYQLKVAPHMVTHVKLMDVEIETELGYIKNHIDNFYLWPRISLLTNGKNYSWTKSQYERAKYINKIKNISGYNSIEAYLDLET